ncbi:MAG: biotin--[acetyl-CoA-carboxylase] ligase [Acidimicrobiia bacterium]|nr:biotin--[acetyl-CoA-carboxylase] ligase [Acidimicrobiia bacterium]
MSNSSEAPSDRPGEPLDRARLDGLSTRFGDIRWVASTGSTNADLAAAAAAGAPDGVVLVADEQTSGRGRRGRAWSAASGDALLVSVLLRPTTQASDVGWVVSAAAIALVEACEVVGLDRARLKWPNDVVVTDPAGDRKLAGILAESVVSGQSIAALVVGVGCNVAADMPAGLPEATSVDREAGRAVDRFELLSVWLGAFDRWLARLDGGDVAAVRGRYRELSATIGREVVVETDEGSFRGRALDVDVHGHLIVATADGERTVGAGDVITARPVR